MSKALLLLAMFVGVAHAQSGGTQVREAAQQKLPAMRGTALQVRLIEVTYAPGGSSKPHSHGCPVVGYVVSGAVRMQVRGEAEKIYKAGDTFYEAANGVHQVSANASATEPAKFLAYFVCDGDQPLSTPVQGGAQ